jgi:hypothetical protein
LPELIIVEKVPDAVDVKLPEANSLPGRGGLTRTYAYAGDSKLLLHDGTQGEVAEIGLLVTVILNKPECCRRLVTGGLPGGSVAETLLPPLEVPVTTI